MEQAETQKPKEKQKPRVETHYFDIPRQELLDFLHISNPGWQFKLGHRRLGEEHFRSEHPEFEIVSEWRPILRVRKDRYAVYAKKQEGIL